MQIERVGILGKQVDRYKQKIKGFKMVKCGPLGMQFSLMLQT